MRWIINIASNYLRFIANMVIVFLMTPFIIDQIGQNLFGLWSLVFALVAMFGLLDAGFATTAVKYVSEYWASKQEEKLAQTLGTLILVYSGLGLLCLLLVWNLAPVLADAYALTGQTATDFVRILQGLGLVIALSFPLSLYRAILIGTGKMSVVNLTDLCFALLNAAGMYLFLSQGWGILGLALSTGTTMLASFLVFVPCARILVPGVRVAFRAFRWQQLRELTSFSIYVFVANIAMLVILRIDPLVIGQYLTLEAVAVYAIAAKIAEYSYLLNKQFSNALMPLISQSEGTQNRAAVARIMVDGTRYLLAIATPFLGLLALYAPQLVDLWVGADFQEAGVLLQVLMVSVFVGALQLLPANVLGLGGQHRLIAGVMALSALLNLVFSLILIQFFGLLGVALGTVLATLLVEMGVVIPRACKQIEVGLMHFLSKALVPALLPALPMLGVALFAQSYWSIDSLLSLVLVGALSGLTYLAVFACVGVTRDERHWLIEQLRARFSVARERVA